MIRSIKNTFAPIDRVPPEVLSLIAGYFSTDNELITLTHVCRSWREIFTSHASLWTFLDCTSFDKTDVYIQRSRGSPLEIYLTGSYSADALFLALPLINQLKALTVSGSRNVLSLTKYFDSHAPLLEKLDIQVRRASPAPIESTIFGGNLSPLRELRLYAVITDLPWKNLTKLTTFEFHQVPGNEISVTQLLDFFERAPLLREIELVASLPDSSNAPLERVVSLNHLRSLRIDAQQPHSILLNHLHIPVGALARLEFKVNNETVPISDYLPTPLDNLSNISRITSVNLSFQSGMAMRLGGPNGGLYVVGTCASGGSAPTTLDAKILRYLNKFPISMTEMLAVTLHDGSADLDREIEESGAYRTLLLMNNLRTLTLTGCINLSFISALNPDCNTSHTTVCPKLEELIFYTRGDHEDSCIEELLEMAKGRALRNAELSIIVVICARKFFPAEKAFELRRYAKHVEYRPDDEPSSWDTIPDDFH